MAMRSKHSSRPTRSCRTAVKRKVVGGREDSKHRRMTPDLALLRPSIETSISGLKQATHLLETGTPEIVHLLTYECDVIYECKVCHNLFRSLANLISHKRVYCTKRFIQVKNAFKANPEGMEERVHVVNDAKVPEKFKGVLQSRVTARRDLTTVLESFASKTSSGPASHTIHLQPIDTTAAGFFQTLNATPEGELIKNKVKELQDIILNNSEVTLGPNGQVLDDPFIGATANLYKCKTCSKQCSSQRALDTHMKSVHTKYRQCFGCPYCKNYYSSTWGVNRHLLTAHRKTSEQVQRLKNQYKRKLIPVEEPVKSLGKTNPKIVPLAEKPLQENNEPVQTVADANLRCERCGCKFVHRATFLSHSQLCSKQTVVSSGASNVNELLPGILPNHTHAESAEKKIEIQVRYKYNKETQAEKQGEIGKHSGDVGISTSKSYKKTVVDLKERTLVERIGNGSKLEKKCSELLNAISDKKCSRKQISPTRQWKNITLENKTGKPKDSSEIYVPQSAELKRLIDLQKKEHSDTSVNDTRLDVVSVQPFESNKLSICVLKCEEEKEKQTDVKKSRFIQENNNSGSKTRASCSRSVDFSNSPAESNVKTGDAIVGIVDYSNEMCKNINGNKEFKAVSIPGINGARFEPDETDKNAITDHCYTKDAKSLARKELESNKDRRNDKSREFTGKPLPNRDSKVHEFNFFSENVGTNETSTTYASSQVGKIQELSDPDKSDSFKPIMVRESRVLRNKVIKQEFSVRSVASPTSELWNDKLKKPSEIDFETFHKNFQSKLACERNESQITLSECVQEQKEIPNEVDLLVCRDAEDGTKEVLETQKYNNPGTLHHLNEEHTDKTLLDSGLLNIQDKKQTMAKILTNSKQSIEFLPVLVNKTQLGDSSLLPKSKEHVLMSALQQTVKTEKTHRTVKITYQKDIGLKINAFIEPQQNTMGECQVVNDSKQPETVNNIQSESNENKYSFILRNKSPRVMIPRLTGPQFCSSRKEAINKEQLKVGEIIQLFNEGSDNHQDITKSAMELPKESINVNDDPDATYVLTKHQAKEICKYDSVKVGNEVDAQLNKIDFSSSSSNCSLNETFDESIQGALDIAIVENKMLEFINCSRIECLICSRRFRNMEIIRRHIAMHLNWSRYRCLVKSCKFNCFVKGDCFIHIQNSHGNMERRSKASDLIGVIPSHEWNLDFDSLRQLIEPKVQCGSDNSNQILQSNDQDVIGLVSLDCETAPQNCIVNHSNVHADLLEEPQMKRRRIPLEPVRTAAARKMLPDHLPILKCTDSDDSSERAISGIESPASQEPHLNMPSQSLGNDDDVRAMVMEVIFGSGAESSVQSVNGCSRPVRNKVTRKFNDFIYDCKPNDEGSTKRSLDSIKAVDAFKK